MASALEQRFKFSDSPFQFPLFHGPDQDIRQVTHRVSDPWINLSFPDLIDRCSHESDHALTVFNVHVRRAGSQRLHAVLASSERLRFPPFSGLYPQHEPEFDLALHTGMRRGEQYRLRWQNVDLKHGIITIGRSKTGEARRIQTNSTARDALLGLRERGDGVGYVCPGYDGPRTRDCRNWFETAVQAAGIQNLRWHDLRHTFASRLVMAGVPLRAVQVLMGHKRIETTLRYSHLGETHLHEAVERLTEKPTATSTSGPVVDHMPATA